MRTIVLIIALALNCPMYLQAQGLNFGAKGGINFANVGGEDSDFDFKSKTGYHAGLVSEIFFTERFALQPELLYSTQGAKIEESGTEFGMPYTLKSTLYLDYINIPILAKYYLTQGLSLELGPQVGFIVKGEQEYELSFGEEFESGTEDIKDDLNSPVFGLAGGLGYKINDGIVLNARYILGLSDIQKSERSFDEDFLEDISLKNFVLQFSIGYMF